MLNGGRAADNHAPERSGRAERSLYFKRRSSAGSAAERRSVIQRRWQVGPDERAIRELHSTWIDAVNAGDLGHLLTLMADDVVFLSPGQAPFGRDGFCR